MARTEADARAQQAALSRWFESQQISFEDAIVLMIELTSSAIVVKAPKDMPAACITNFACGLLEQAIAMAYENRRRL